MHIVVEIKCENLIELARFLYYWVDIMKMNKPFISHFIVKPLLSDWLMEEI